MEMSTQDDGGQLSDDVIKFDFILESQSDDNVEPRIMADIDMAQKSINECTSDEAISMDTNIETVWKQFMQFEEFRRSSDSLQIKDYVEEWENRAQDAIRAGCCAYSDLGLAFTLLDRANLNQAQLEKVLSLLQDLRSSRQEQEATASESDSLQIDSKRYPFLSLAVNYLKIESASCSKKETCDITDIPDSLEQSLDHLDGEDLIEDLTPNRVEDSGSKDMVSLDQSSPVRKRKGVRRIHKCPECGRVFKRLDHLKRHVETHARRRSKLWTKLTCPACSENFNNVADCRKHFKKHHALNSVETKKPKTKDNDSLMCYICARTFSSPDYLKVHIRIHKGERPFQCDFCEKAYPDRTSLKAHLLSHTTTRSFICDDCGKTFPTNFRLIRHKATHVGAKPFKCDQCGQAFHEKSKLNRHEGIHSTEKPFECQTCGKRFKNQQNLYQHAKIHLSEKERRPKTTNFPEVPNNDDNEKVVFVDESRLPMTGQLVISPDGQHFLLSEADNFSHSDATQEEGVDPEDDEGNSYAIVSLLPSQD